MTAGERVALISVSNKEGLVPFASLLVDVGFAIVASGGTARLLRESGVPVREVSEVTGFPEILGGRVKTLHPAIHGGILSRRTAEDAAQLAAQGIAHIDLVVVNLYPFWKTLEQPNVPDDEAMELVDIGGVALLRAAAKNFRHVVVVCDPKDYDWVGARLREGDLTVEERRRLAAKAFQHTATYDAMIGAYLAGTGGMEGMPDGEYVALFLKRAQALRYGENPHQAGWIFVPAWGKLPFRQLHGKEMSYNNWLDVDAAWRAATDFAEPTVAIIKHGNPCGLASAATLVEAYKKALASDPVSAFGSVIAVNRPLDEATAEAMRDLFIEVLAAPAFSEGALQILTRKSRFIRLLVAEETTDRWEWRTIRGAWLRQEVDRSDVDDRPELWRVVTERAPSAEEWEALRFAWKVVKHVKSNAIVLVQGTATVGVGAGQMSRVDAVRMAVWKAGDRARGAVLASDAFFPFPDGVELAAQAGVTAIVQPGGSKRDEEVIAAANRLGLAMVFTGVRHFRH